LTSISSNRYNFSLWEQYHVTRVTQSEWLKNPYQDYSVCNHFSMLVSLWLTSCWNNERGNINRRLMTKCNRKIKMKGFSIHLLFIQDQYFCLFLRMELLNP